MQGVYPEAFSFDMSKVRFPLKLVDKIRKLWEDNGKVLWIDRALNFDSSKPVWDIDERNIDLYTEIPQSEFDVQEGDLEPGEVWTPETEGFTKIDEAFFKALTRLAMED